MIIIKNLSHQYNSNSEDIIKTLKNVNLEIKKGSFVSIIGNNGSGKSTLAKHLNGLIIPQEGSVTIDSKPVLNDESIWEIRRKVGMVFQNPDNQFIGGLVEEDIAFGLENIGIPSSKMEEIILKASSKVGMNNFLKKAPECLSGGQKQRSAIAAILAINPSYLVLDEPTSMLDPKGRREILNTIIELNRKEKVTVILITHFIEEVIFSDKIILMENGNKILDEAPKKFFKNSDYLLKKGIKLPKALEISIELKKRGIDLGEEVILTKEELVKKLCQLK